MYNSAQPLSTLVYYSVVLETFLKLTEVSAPS